MEYDRVLGAVSIAAHPSYSLFVHSPGIQRDPCLNSGSAGIGVVTREHRESFAADRLHG